MQNRLIYKHNNTWLPQKERGTEEEISQLLLTMMMKGYSDSAMPLSPLSQIPHSSSSVDPSQPIAQIQMGNSNANTTSSRKRAGTNSESLKMERERRSKMTHMFTQLQATVPGVFPKATKEVIINETIRYIKELEKKKQRLEELKESMTMKPMEGRLMLPCTTNRNCSITVTVSSNVAFFGIQSVARHGLITMIFKVFNKHQAEILAANVSVDQGKLMLAITAVVQNGDGDATVEMIKREIMRF